MIFDEGANTTQWGKDNFFFLFFFFFFNIYLAVLLGAAGGIFTAACGIFSCSMWDLELWHVGSSSLTRD